MSATICEDGNDGFGAFGRFASRSSPGIKSPSDNQQSASGGGKRSPLGQLTDGQKDCLRLVYNHMTSKDIARDLGVSPHTVDMRLRTAMKVLGVATRIEAARLLVLEEQGPDAQPMMPAPAPSPSADGTYQPLIYGSSDMASEPNLANFGASASAASASSDRLDPANLTAHQLLNPTFDPSLSGPPRNANASITSEAEMLGSRWGAGTTDPGSGARPLATANLPWGARNTLSVPMRFAWIAGISIGSALSFGAVLSALSSLKSLL
jgi:DNA-binding CsgD family transcriptional regulator